MTGRGKGIGLVAETEGAACRARPGRLSLFAAGIVLGGSLSLVGGEPLRTAHLPSWLETTSAKDADRLAATAGPAEASDAGGACTALVLDRFTGLIAALACSQSPAMRQPLALRRSEIES